MVPESRVLSSDIRVINRSSFISVTTPVVGVTGDSENKITMGRPPNVPCNSPTRPWAPPVHLAGGLLRGILTPHANKVRQFVLPIPPVHVATAKAIRTSLAGTAQPFAAQQNHIRVLSTRLLDQRAKVVAIQKRVTELEDEKEQGLRDIRETRQQETAEIVAVVERKLRSRYNKETAAAHSIWKDHLDEECEAKRKAWRQKQEEQNADEPDKKRTKLEDKQDVIVDANDTVKSDATAIIKESKIVERSDILQSEVIESEATLEKLTETRTEIVWLLKQVIKAGVKLPKTTSAVTKTTVTTPHIYPPKR